MQFQYTIHPLPKTSPKKTAVVTPSAAPSSRCKAVIVILLSWLLAWHPTLAMTLGKVVTWLWLNFRRA